MHKRDESEILLPNTAKLTITSAITMLLLTLSISPSALAQSPTEVPPVNSGDKPSPDVFNLPDGYSVDAVAWGLNLPTSVAFDDQGNMYVAESGYIYGEYSPTPRILKVDSNGNATVLLDRLLSAPINDIEFHDGKLYVSHRGIISSVEMNGVIKDVIVGLPAMGDHHNNEIEIGPDGRLYVSIGTVTNTGVVGEDNALFGWLKVAPQLHDVPGQDITLAGVNYNSTNPLTPDKLNDTATTGGYVAFGNSTKDGQVVKGNPKCNGCVISANPDGSDLQLEAWGLRNPFGLAFGEDGKLYATNNGADERGSRPIANDNDKVYEIKLDGEPRWYGFPDYFGNAEPVTAEKFKSPAGNQSLEFLMKDHPQVEKPLAIIDKVAAAITGIDTTNSTNFGINGSQAFIAEFGSMAPATHPLPTKDIVQEVIPQTGNGSDIIGQKVIMLDPTTGNYTEFLSIKSKDAPFRPVGVLFNDNENALYVVSIAKVDLRTELPNGTPLPVPLPWAYPNTGVVWKVTYAGSGNATQTAGANNTDTNPLSDVTESIQDLIGQ